MIYIDGNIINDLLPARGDKNRPFIRGVHIQDVNDKRIYTATNGHILLRQYTSKPQDEGIKDGGILLNIPCKLKTRKNEMMTLEFKGIIGNEQVHIFGTKENIIFDFEDNPYPPNAEKIVSEALKNTVEGKWIPFAPRYLVMICDFFKTLALESPLLKEGEEYHAAGVWIRKEFNPVKNELEIEKLALLMPVRI